MIHADGLNPCLCQWDEHPAGPTSQLQYWTPCLGGQFKPERKIIQVPVVVGMVKLWEHITPWMA
jgi:hypothetical protein